MSPEPKVRIAHVSDLHVTLPPSGEPLVSLLGKRVIGTVGYYALSRRRRFRHAAHRIERLLADVDAQQIDHVLCTGDMSSMSTPSELSCCARLFGTRLGEADRYTVIPGNHDRYTASAVEQRLFERWFGQVSSPAGDYPYVKPIGGGVTLVLLDVSRPTFFIDASGRCGHEQRARLIEILKSPALKGQFVVVALHYGLLKANGKRLRRMHRLRDELELLAALEAPEVRVDLILHGHCHEAYWVRAARRLAVCAGSATDLAFRCGYNIVSIDTDKRAFQVERRVWSGARDAFIEEQSAPFMTARAAMGYDGWVVDTSL